MLVNERLKSEHLPLSTTIYVIGPITILVCSQLREFVQNKSQPPKPVPARDGAVKQAPATEKS